MIYKYVCFVRGYGNNQDRGEIAGLPNDNFPLTSEPFIVCRVDESILTEDLLRDDKIRLNLEKLQKPNSTKEIVDEDGTPHTVPDYDYFDVDGRSSEEESPVIDLNDVIQGGEHV